MTRLSVSQARQLGILPGKKKSPKAITPAVQWDAKTFPGGIWLQVPEVPPSLNEWMHWHWSKQARYKKELTEAIRGLALAMKLPRYLRATVQPVIYFAVHRVRDPSDNYNQKFLADALVRGGILADDRGDWVRFEVPKLVVDKLRPRVEVFIWEV